MRRLIRATSVVGEMTRLGTQGTFWNPELETSIIEVVVAPARALAEAWATTARRFGITNLQSVADAIETADGLHSAMLRHRDQQQEEQPPNE